MKLKAAREASGKTQSEVANEVKISERMYQKYEYGVEPGVRAAIRIARTLGVRELAVFYSLWEQQNEPDSNQAGIMHSVQ